jgi:hypothetical protein
VRAARFVGGCVSRCDSPATALAEPAGIPSQPPRTQLDVSIVAGATSLEAKNSMSRCSLVIRRSLVAHRIAERCCTVHRSYLERYGT